MSTQAGVLALEYGCHKTLQLVCPLPSVALVPLPVPIRPASREQPWLCFSICLLSAMIHEFSLSLGASAGTLRFPRPRGPMPWVLSHQPLREAQEDGASEHTRIHGSVLGTNSTSDPISALLTCGAREPWGWEEQAWSESGIEMCPNPRNLILRWTGIDRIVPCPAGPACPGPCPLSSVLYTLASPEEVI